jgi:hypothetical protein
LNTALLHDDCIIPKYKNGDDTLRTNAGTCVADALVAVLDCMKWAEPSHASFVTTGFDPLKACEGRF